MKETDVTEHRVRGSQWSPHGLPCPPGPQGTPLNRALCQLSFFPQWCQHEGQMFLYVEGCSRCFSMWRAAPDVSLCGGLLLMFLYVEGCSRCSSSYPQSAATAARTRLSITAASLVCSDTQFDILGCFRLFLERGVTLYSRRRLVDDHWMIYKQSDSGDRRDVQRAPPFRQLNKL